MLKKFRIRSSKKRFLFRFIVGLATTAILLNQLWLTTPVKAETQAYCQLSEKAIAEKERLHSEALKGNSDDQNRYKDILKQHAAMLQKCRSETWPNEQAIWLRLYPCDILPGSIERTLDHIVNRGYNKVYLETFFDGQVLLPQDDNPTPWSSVVRSPGTENVDLLAQAIEKGHERGLKVYAWLFSMNFGYAYSQLSDRQDVLARNGKGQDSTMFVSDGSQTFIDPYNRQAKIDYYNLIQTVAKRKPDGMLFDYIRYPRGTGTESVASNVKDLWIYSNASREALYQRASNRKGLALIERFVDRGYITVGDIKTVDELYPDEDVPRWQGRTPSPTEIDDPLPVRQDKLQQDLWYLAVAHAAQGVLDFLTFAKTVAERQGIPAGAVFFSDSNIAVGITGFDSRLQPWDRFPRSLEWHPMSYAVCGNTGCVVDQVRRVASGAPVGTEVIPAIAGLWGKSYDNRPSLEDQMQAIRQAVPQVNAVSHFAYSWQEPERDKARRFCQIE
ncbi:MAG: family 10 glycosylhydrolase [Halothece sp.]